MDGVISELVRYDRRPEDLSREIADTVSEITKIYAKSTRTTLRTISLLKLFSEEFSDLAHPVSIAITVMQDIPGIRIIESRQKSYYWEKYDIK